MFRIYRGTFADGSVHEVRLVLDRDKIGGFQVAPLVRPLAGIPHMAGQFAARLPPSG